MAKTPPILLGKRLPGAQVVTHFDSRELNQGEYLTLKSKLITHFPGVTLNDWILCAMIKAIDTFVKAKTASGEILAGGKDRISVYIPMDVRRQRPVSSPLWNPLTGGQIDIMPDDRKDLKTLLTSVAEQTKTIKNPYLRCTTFDFVKVLVWLAKTFHLNLNRVGKNSWKHACTVCLSNSGKIEYLERATDIIEGVYGAPPSTAPIGFLVGIVSLQDKLCFGFNCADYCINLADANRLIDQFMENLRA